MKLALCPTCHTWRVVVTPRDEDEPDRVRVHGTCQRRRLTEHAERIELGQWLDRNR